MMCATEEVATSEKLFTQRDNNIAVIVIKLVALTLEVHSIGGGSFAQQSG